jgi:hypothetical protein
MSHRTGLTAMDHPTVTAKKPVSGEARPASRPGDALSPRSPASASGAAADARV